MWQLSVSPAGTARKRKLGLPQSAAGASCLFCFGDRGWRIHRFEGVKKSIALTTETQRHREKPLSFQSSVPPCLCGEKFVP